MIRSHLGSDYDIVEGKQREKGRSFNCTCHSLFQSNSVPCSFGLLMKAPRVRAVGHRFETVAADAFPTPIRLGRHELEKEQPPLTADEVTHQEITHHLYKRDPLFKKYSRKPTSVSIIKHERIVELISINKERP